MSALVHRVVSFVRQHGLLDPGTRVVCAVSGGADSTALAHLMVAAAPRLAVTVAGLAHVHHGLRGAEADADEDACRALAAALGLPIVVERARLTTPARRPGRSVEHEARLVRYACLERARLALDAGVVATGHTLDDQAETLLLRLARGAGPAALVGIRRRRGSVVRPLLGVRHRELVDYLGQVGLGWREDASNRELAIPRNRVRHRVLPVLAAELSPRVVDALGRLAELAAEENALLEQWALSRFEAVVRPAAEGVDLDADALRAEPVALQRRIVTAALVRVGGHEDVTARHVEAVLGLVRRGREGGRVMLHRRMAWLAGHRLRIVAAAGGLDRAPAGGDRSFAAVERQVRVPGVLYLWDGRRRLLASVVPRVDIAGWRPSPEAAVVDAGLAGPVLRVRPRRPGDRLRPVGMTGHRKLQDLLVDRKVPRTDRDLVPVVTDAAGRIIWVAGHAVSADFQVRAETTSVLLLQVQPSGGAG